MASTKSIGGTSRPPHTICIRRDAELDSFVVEVVPPFEAGITPGTAVGSMHRSRKVSTIRTPVFFS